jgi:hypothetical protein
VEELAIIIRKYYGPEAHKRSIESFLDITMAADNPYEVLGIEMGVTESEVCRL